MKPRLACPSCESVKPKPGLGLVFLFCSGFPRFMESGSARSTVVAVAWTRLGSWITGGE